jgi:diguanylate cyclase (GGDEF)-like protein
VIETKLLDKRSIDVIGEYILRLDIIIFSLLLLSLVLLFLFNDNQERALQNTLFRAFTVSAMVVLALEIPCIISTGNPRIRTFNIVSTTLYHILQNIPLVLYVGLLDLLLNQNKKQTKKILIYWLPFLFLSTALPILNLFIPLFYTIDETGTFRRQFLMPLILALPYVPLIAILRTLVIKRHRLDTTLSHALWFIPIPVLLAGVVQFFFTEQTLTWPFISLGITGLGLALQQKRFNEDYLTGAYNRQHLDTYLHLKLRNSKPNKTFSAFLIDVDNFKRINDEFGHKTGDEALIESVRIFKSAVRNSDFVGRYAGDEFVIVFDTTDQTNLENLASRIHQTADSFNASAGKFYTLTYSIGMGIFDPLLDVTIDNFIKRIDQDMYTVKRRKKTSQYMYDNRSSRR